MALMEIVILAAIDHAHAIGRDLVIASTAEHRRRGV